MALTTHPLLPLRLQMGWSSTAASRVSTGRSRGDLYLDAQLVMSAFISEHSTLHSVNPQTNYYHIHISFIHSTGMCGMWVLCRSQELLPFLSVMYFFLPPFSTNYSSILSHLILPSISWSIPQSCCFQIHIQYPFWNSISFHSQYMPKPT